LKKIIKEKPSKEAPAHLPPPPMVKDCQLGESQSVDGGQSVDGSEIDNQ
jgi:hypothetical protein